MKDPEILYEDKDILAINKPAGLIVHPDGRTEEPSVSEWFALKYPEAQSVGEDVELESGEKIERPGVVHRIDRETSGVLLLAKTEEGHKTLKKQFQNREVEKVYHLFVHGVVKDDFGTIKLTIGKSVSNFRKWSAEKGARGEKREALTYFKTLKRIPELPATLLEAKPQTGRTHQIRVHFKALHHPLVADSLYAPKASKLFGFERLALHARSIAFKNTEGKQVEVTAPYPEDFKMALDKVEYSVLD